jgi:hypothetical protein
MNTSQEPDRDSGHKAPKAWGGRSIALAALAALLCTGILLRMAGVLLPAWALMAVAAALAFVFLLPAMGARMQEPEGSPLKKAPWGG